MTSHLRHAACRFLPVSALLSGLIGMSWMPCRAALEAPPPRTMESFLAETGGSSWAAPISSLHDPAGAVQAVVPRGEYHTFAVGFMPECKVQLPGELEAEVFVVKYFPRYVEGRWYLRPYYMVTRKQHPPTGMWAVRFKADLPPGTHKLTITSPGVSMTDPAPIEGWFRNNNMPTEISYEFEVVDLNVPPADIAFGVYYEPEQRVYEEYRGPEFQEMYIRDMAEHGMTSVTIYGGGDQQDTLNRYVPLLKKYGMDRFPVMVLPTSDEGLVSEKDGVRLMLYGPDEPFTLPEDEALSQCTASRERADRFGMLHTTALNDAACFGPLGELFDVWIVHRGGVSDALHQRARELNAEVWMYDCYLRGTNPKLHRYFFGVYTWAMGVKGCFRWAYTHYADSCIKPDGTWNALMFYDYVLPTPDGPMPTVGWEGSTTASYEPWSKALTTTLPRPTPGTAWRVGWRKYEAPSNQSCTRARARTTGTARIPTIPA